MTLEVPPAPTAEQEAQLAEAVIQRAARNLVGHTGPLGFFGEVTEFGQAISRPDYQTQEYLKGLRTTVTVTVADLLALVSNEDVIRAGLQADPATFPAARIPDVERARTAAAAQIALGEVEGAFGLA